MRKWFTILIPFFIAASIQAQCSCTDCDVNLPDVGNAYSTLTLNGANSPIMGQNGQYLRAVSLNILHDAIDELDIVLISPDGNAIPLSTFQGIQVGQNITFDICFVACNETPQPDPGFPAVFESDAGYGQNGFYNGSYYPAIGCLENLTGNINGTWTLDITDNFIQDGGTLLDWSLEFANNDGLTCTESCLPPLCAASASQIGLMMDTFCRGDQALDFNINPTFPGSQPDTTLFDYKFIVLDHETKVILDYTLDPDLSNYSAGTYDIYGMAHEIIDAALIPPADGQYTLTDLIEDITNNQFCAKLSEDHFQVTVMGNPEIPKVAVADKACAGEEVVYSIENYNANYKYSLEVIDGNILEELEPNDSTFIVRWDDGPGEVLIWVSNYCDSVFAYEVVAIEQAPEVSIIGQQNVCPEDTLIYSLSEIENNNLQFNFTVIGGEVIWISNDTIAIVWDGSLSSSSLCANFNGIDCPPPTLCKTISIEESLETAQELHSPDSVCQFEQCTSFIPADSNIVSYQWSGSGIQILDGNGTDSVTYLADNSGTVEICLQLTSVCGETMTICEEIAVAPKPSSSIEPINEVCGKSFILNANAAQENELQWTQLSGPKQAVFTAVNESTTEVEVEAYGTYVFEFTEKNLHCESRDSVVVEINAPPEITNLNYDCSMQTYRVSFDIEGGTPPFTIDGIRTSGRTFISNSYPSGNAFSILVSDSKGCNDQINGFKACPCVSSAGHMGSDTLYVCAASTESARATYDQDAVVTSTDTTVFVLHTSEDIYLGDIFAINNSGVFTYQPDMDYGEIYFISRVVGEKTNNGINLQDSCLSVAKGQPVIYYSSPTTNLESVVTTCSKTFTLHAGTGSNQLSINWKQLSGPSTAVITDPENANTEVSVPNEGMYTFECMISNNACTSKESVQVKVLKSPEITAVNKQCQNSNEVQLQIGVNSDALPLTINLPGKWDQNVFYTINLPLDTIYEITIEDANACATTILIDAGDCDCPELMLPSELNLCDSENEIDLDQQFGISMNGRWSLQNPNNLLNPPKLIHSRLILDGATGGSYDLKYQFDHQNSPECANEYFIELRLENQRLSGAQNGIPHYCQGNEMKVYLDTLLAGNHSNGLWIYGTDTIHPLIDIDHLTPGIQEFKYIMSTQSICKTKASYIRLEVNPEPTINIHKNDVSCNGDQYGSIEVIVDEPFFGPYSYYLNGEKQFTNIFEELYAGEYKLLVRNRNGCSKELDPIRILEPLPIELDLGEDRVVERNEAFTVRAKTNISNSEIEQIIWEGSNGIIAENDLHLSYSLASSSYIKATLIDASGCAVMDKIFIAIDDGTEVYLPNVFYPQGDHPENRRFGIHETEDISFIKSFRIYDRWGNRVFEHINFQPGERTAFWNGTFDGHVSPMGVYIYTVTFVNTDGKEKTEKGNVTLLY